PSSIGAVTPVLRTTRTSAAVWRMASASASPSRAGWYATSQPARVRPSMPLCSNLSAMRTFIVAIMVQGFRVQGSRVHLSAAGCVVLRAWCGCWVLSAACLVRVLVLGVISITNRNPEASRIPNPESRIPSRLYDMNQQAVSQLRLEPCGLGGHDGAGIGHGHEVADCNRMQRERHGCLARIDKSLELSGPAGAADEVDPLVRAHVENMEH